MSLAARLAARRARVARAEFEAAVRHLRPAAAAAALGRLVRDAPGELWVHEELMVLAKISHNWPLTLRAATAALELRTAQEAASTPDARRSDSAAPEPLPVSTASSSDSETRPSSPPDTEASPSESSGSAPESAAELTGVLGSDAAWTLGIAATALGEWELAASAWESFGFELDPDAERTQPVELPLGVLGLRLNPPPAGLATARVALPERPGPLPAHLSQLRAWAASGAPGAPATGELSFSPPLELPASSELLWARRLDPARAQILSVPLRESGHRRGDIVLHDGVPTGALALDGERTAPVLDELACLTPSPIPTVALLVEVSSAAHIESLAALVGELGGAVEDWGASLVHTTSTASLPGELAGSSPDSPQGVDNPVDTDSEAESDPDPGSDPGSEQPAPSDAAPAEAAPVHLAAEDASPFTPLRALGVSLELTSFPALLDLWVSLDPSRSVISFELEGPEPLFEQDARQSDAVADSGGQPSPPTPEAPRG